MRPRDSGSAANTLRRTIAREIPAPNLPYRPSRPRRYRPKIGLIGCGGITTVHLQAYRTDGYAVVALADRVLASAEKRRDEFYPEAEVYDDYRVLLARPDIDVVDVATHPEIRPTIVADALRAGKHVLSQKPLALDLATARRLVVLARRQRRLLAVNQNGRWSPYFAYLRSAVSGGLLGEIQTADFVLNWDHTWTRGTAFEEMRHLILLDFGLHWFDIVACVFEGRKARRITAHVTRSPGQLLKPPMLAHCAIEFDQGLATLSFNGYSPFGARETFNVCGTAGTLRGEGAGVIQVDHLDLFTSRGHARPQLEGVWMPDGFRGTMGELLCAIEEQREPANSAANNLQTLALCFASLKSADTHRPQIPAV